MSGTASRIFGLDMIRFIAIVLVLVSHAREFVVDLLPGIGELRVFGYFGVELFFVLSGFLIGGILIKTFEKSIDFGSLKTFWIRRWYRTLPNYYLFVIINILLFFILQSPELRLKFSRLPLYFAFLQNFAWPKFKFFSESWSLCIEEWFYLTYPVCVFFVHKVLRTTAQRAFLLSTLIFVVVPVMLRFYFGGIKNFSFDVTREIVVGRLDAMMTGVFIVYLKFYHKAVFDRLKTPGFLIGISGGVAIFLFNIYGNTETLLSKTIMLSLLIISFGLLLPYLSGVKYERLNIAGVWVERISLWSYSLYLVNMPVRYLLVYLRDTYKLNSHINSLVLTFFFFSLSIAFSSLLYKYVELYFLKVRDRATQKEAVHILT